MSGRRARAGPGNRLGMRGCSRRGWRVRGSRYAGLPTAWMVVALAAGGCEPSDPRNASAPADAGGGAGAAAPTTRQAPPPPFELPDLSPLAPWAQDQVRERHDALQEALAAGADASGAGLAEAYGELGLVLMAVNYYDAARTCYRHAQALAPRDRRWPYYLGHLYRLTEDRTEAAAWFERALELAPSDEATLVWLGRIYLDQGRPDAAERLFMHAATVEPESAAAWAGVGQAALARRDYLRATEALERAIELDPAASAVRYPLAMAYRALGERDAAVTHLQQRGNRGPGIVDPLMLRFQNVLQGPMLFELHGNQALAAGDAGAAIELYRQGLALAPGEPSLRHRLATALAAAGDAQGAAAELQEALRAAPEFAAAHGLLGAVLATQGRHREAVDRFATALEHDPGHIEARLGMAESLRVDGRLEESLAHYERVAAEDPGFVEAWIGRAEVLIRLGRYPEAQAWLTDARRVHPGQPEIARLAEALAVAPPTRR